MGAKNLLNPTLMGAFRACKTLSLWVQIFPKQGHSGGMSAETRSTEEHPMGTGPLLLQTLQELLGKLTLISANLSSNLGCKLQT